MVSESEKDILLVLAKAFRSHCNVCTCMLYPSILSLYLSYLYPWGCAVASLWV